MYCNARGEERKEESIQLLDNQNPREKLEAFVFLSCVVQRPHKLRPRI